jgi:peptidoglycan/LPS O-acetylase OafA/YrhL
MGERSTQVPPIAGWLMIVGGVALAVLTFVDWYELFGVGVNAWQTLTRTDVAIFAAGIVAAACGAWLVFGDVGPERRVVAPFGALAAGLGAIAVFVRMVSPPADLPLKFGIYLALAAALAATVGGVVGTLSTFGSPRPPRRAGPEPRVDR